MMRPLWKGPRSLTRTITLLPLLTLVIMMALSWGLEQANHPAGQLAFIATTLVGLWPVARQALRLIKSGSWVAIETLMSVAAIGALFIGATAEAAMVLLLLASLGLFVAWIMGRHARRLGETSRDPSMMIDPAELRRLRELAEARRTATPPPTEPPAP